MREYAKKPESQSRILDSNPKASSQASIGVILQRYKERNIQRYAEDEELIEGKFDTAQRETLGEDELLQGKFEASSTIQRKKKSTKADGRTNTGMPDNLKNDIESLSGYSMNDVRVHYNSPKPAQLQALAYAQGTDIHIASGQEQHLPHEAWHVVQQKQGRVQPTMQLQGVNVNDNERLEKEADQFSLNYPMVKTVIQRQPIHNDNFGYGFQNLTARELLTGTGQGAIMRQNMQNGNGYHLGWGSLIGFTTNANGQFNFNQRRNQGQNIPINAVAGTQVVTRGVTSCSTIIVSQNGNHAMAHLDLNDLNQANLQFLIQQVPPLLGQQINHPQIFVSLYDRPNGNPNGGGFRPATFARTLISTYYPGININPWNNQNQSLIQYLTNGIPAGHNIKVLNRNTEYGAPFIHPEIGLEIDPNLGLQTFGSIQGNELVTLNHIATSRNQFVENINSPQANYNVLSERGRRNQIFSRIKAIPLKILRWLRLIQ